MIGGYYILLVLIIILHHYAMFSSHLSGLQYNFFTVRPAKYAMRWLRQLVVDLSPRRSGFKPNLVLWDMWCTKWHCDRFSHSMLIHSFIIVATECRQLTASLNDTLQKHTLE